MAELKLCKDCRWAVPGLGHDAIDEMAVCTHTSSRQKNVSLVTGEEIQHLLGCSYARTIELKPGQSWDAEPERCGPNGTFWEAADA
jgi:hypothetical protein